MQAIAPPIEVDDATIQQVGGVLSVKPLGIGTDELAPDAVTADKAADGIIDAAAKVANSVITGPKLADDARADTHLARCGAFGVAAGVSTTATVYFPLAGDYTGTATEANVSWPAPKAATLIEAVVDVSANNFTGTSLVATVRAAGVAIASVNLLGQGAGRFTLAISDADIAAGEALSVSITVVGHTGGNMTVRGFLTRIRWAG